MSSTLRRPLLAVILLAAISLMPTGCAVPVTEESPQRSLSDSARDRTAPSKLAGAPARLDSEDVLVETTVSNWSSTQLVASLVMVAAPGSQPDRARALLDSQGFGGFLVMGANVEGSTDAVAEFVTGLSRDAVFPVLTAVDQEGGIVRRLPGDSGPGGVGLHGASVDAVESAFAARAAVVASSDIAVNFGIVADTTGDRGSYIYSRTLGPTPDSAAAAVAAAVRGERGTTLSTLKHFPGHGASPDDSHVGIPRSEVSFAEWRASYALPFEYGIAEGAPLVMTGHLHFDAVSPLPASLSPTWIHILRTELGFSGVIVTDDLLMLQRSGRAEFADPYTNAVQALAAGNDLILFVLPADPTSVGIDPQTLVDRLAGALDSGELNREAVEASARRVLELRRMISDVAAPSCGPKCEPTPARGGMRSH